jgi:hypothetical protein
MGPAASITCHTFHLKMHPCLICSTTEQGGALDVFDETLNVWHTITFQADGVLGPSLRSVSCLVSLSISGEQSLVTMFGERDPSGQGHQGARKMLADVWLFDIESQTWKEIQVDDGNKPRARGWFDADVFYDSSHLRPPTITSSTLCGALSKFRENRVS